MQLGTLNQLLAAVLAAAPGKQIILFGSSSLLATFPDVDPEDIGVAATHDADFFIDPDDLALRQSLLANLGENKAFHVSTGHYGDFVELRLSESFPDGWRDRLVPVPGFENVVALDPVDMAVTKVAATARSRLARRLGRSKTDRGLKDINTIVALLKGRRIDPEILKARLHKMDYESSLTVESWRVMDEIESLAQEAETTLS